MNVDRVFLPYRVRANLACLVEKEGVPSAGYDHSAVDVKLDNIIVAFNGKRQ
jgi:hypothetical protein